MTPLARVYGIILEATGVDDARTRRQKKLTYPEPITAGQMAFFLRLTKRVDEEKLAEAKRSLGLDGIAITSISKKQARQLIDALR